MKRFHIIDAGDFKLDGGAMFGVVPRRLWARLNPPDEDNLCTWTLRSLVVESGDRTILFDTGIGYKQGEKFRSHFYPSGGDLVSSLHKKGFAPEDITDVFITHFHFDHVGGALEKNESGEIVPTFPNATYWSNQSHYDWAMEPNDRERASFLKENFVPLQELGILKMIPEINDVEWIEGIKIKFSYGHTHAMMVACIPTGEKTVVYCADLLPSAYHVRMPYVMSYDIRPLKTLSEKKEFFEEALENNYILFLEHDPHQECCTLTRDDKGRWGYTTTTLVDALSPS